MASVDSDLAQDLSRLLGTDESAAQSMRAQAEALKNQFGSLHLDPKQAEEFRKQAEAFRDAFKDQDFKIDQKQLDEMKKQMEGFNQQMQENRELFPPQFQ
jgi:hypothetical protein